jgi:nitrogen regulatory protein PII
VENIKRIEIITSSVELKPVIEMLNEVGVSGYTIVTNVTGSGDRGRVIDDLETTLTNVYILTLCNQEHEEGVVTGITPILKKFGGVCIVSDAKWIAH